MEDDDDEIQSHPSAGSRSQDSQRSDIRISVTVATVAPPQNTLTLALPMQKPRTVSSTGAGGGGGGGGGGGRDDCWSEGATAVLIEAWGERYLELNRGNLKQKHWKEVADIVRNREDCSKAPKTDIQCKNRIDTVKKKYKLETAKIASGGGSSTWSFYNRLDQLICTTASVKNGSPSLATPSLRAVPVGIPVGVRSAPVQSIRLKQQQDRQQQQFQLQQQRKRLHSSPPPAYSDSSSESEPESDSYEKKRTRVPFNASSNWRQQKQRDKGRGLREKNRGDSFRELTKAIMKFGEAYEQAESLKLQLMVEMQKQCMKFAKELELQRIQFFMKTQLEVSRLKQRSINVGNNDRNHKHDHQVVIIIP